MVKCDNGQISGFPFTSTKGRNDVHALQSISGKKCKIKQLSVINTN